MKDYIKVEVTDVSDAVTRYLHIVKIIILFYFVFNLIISNFIVNYMLKTLLKILHGIQLTIIMYLWSLKMLRKLLSLKLMYWMIVCGKVESKLTKMLLIKIIWSYPRNIR